MRRMEPMDVKVQVVFSFLFSLSIFLGGFFFLVVYHGARHASDRMGVDDALLLGRLGVMREV